MSGPFGSSQWMYSSGGFYGFPIEQSLKFNYDDNSYLTWTPASAGNRKTWTWSGWVKRTRLGLASSIFSVNFGSNDTDYFDIRFYGDNTFRLGTWNISLTDLSRTYRDVSSWYHIVVAIDTTQATSTNRARLYINGVQQTAVTGSGLTLNQDTAINSANSHRIGFGEAVAAYSNMYLAEVNFIDGQALDPTSFGEFKSGVWIPKQYGGTYGTNGFRLSFADSANIGDDTSGNTNDWTANSLVATDVLLDSPTNNFAVLNPLTGQTNVVLSEGNLAGRATANYRCSIGNFGMSSGKWYFEGMVGSSAAISLNATGLGIATDGVNLNSYLGDNTTDWGYIANTGAIYNGVNTGNRSVPTNGSIIGVAYDADNGDLYFSLNGVWQDSGAAIGTGLSGTWYPAVGYQSDSNIQMILNTGQDSSFAGNKTAQGNTDDNGYGDFFYAPPSGYLALCTANLPNPVIDPAQDDVPADYFQPLIWSGTGVTQQIPLNFTADFVWAKERTVANAHRLYDVIRGENYDLITSTTNAEAFGDYGLNFLGHAYIEVEGSKYFGLSGKSFVSWNWLAGNGTSSNTDGSITSTVSVNQKAGFSVVSYTGTGVTATVGHGLGAAPSVIIIKNRTAPSGYNWNVYHASIGNTQRLYLDSTSAAVSGVWNNTSPTSSVFTIGGNAVYDSGDYIAYCFAEVEGYSKFGSYTGNGSADGPFVYTGFRPAFVIVKHSSGTSSWAMFDDKRNTYNVVDNNLFANLSDAESTFTVLDMLSNGFKIRTTLAGSNTSGSTYIYMAFAANPFKYANAR